jgi:NAD-dependent DNA ligase
VLPPVGLKWGEVLREVETTVTDIRGETIVLTGDLPFDRRAIKSVVHQLGGYVASGVSANTTLIVSGWCEPEEGGQKMKSAADRILDGQKIRMMRGDVFLRIVESLASER